MKRSILFAILLVPILARHVSASPTFISPIYRVYIPLSIAPERRFFSWAIEWNNKVPSQLATLDVRQERQYSCSGQESAQFALLHPGELYIVCDEPDMQGMTPHNYAVWYHDFIMTVQAVDPSARFSPAGFALVLPGLHYTEYAQVFYDEYLALYGVNPLVEEWRFHAFICDSKSIGWWKQKVSEASKWSKKHGAPMTLGSFGMPCKTPESDITATMWAMHDAIVADPNIVSAVWWSTDWFGSPHTLMNQDGSLSQEGKLYIQWR